MKLLILILFISILNLVNSQSTTTSTAYALWNENNDQAIIGMIQLPTGQTKALYTLEGYVHLESNQFSTYNYLTNIISFIAIGSSGNTNVYYFYQYHINSNQLKFIRTFDKDEYEIYSIESSQNDGITGGNDLFVTFISNADNQFSIGYINSNANSEPVQMDTLLGQFASAAFNYLDKSYTVFSVYGTEYHLSNYSTYGQMVNTQIIYPQKGYSPSSPPYSLTYLPSYDNFIFVLDFNGTPTLFNFNGDQMQKVLDDQNQSVVNLVSYAIASTMKTQSNTDKRYYQFASVEPNSYTSNTVINSFNEWGYIDSLSTNILPVNMWCIDS